MTIPTVRGAEQRFEVRATADSHFSWIRTRLSLERTLMAWMRTAVSLVGFGFTIVTFFDRLQELPGVAPVRFPEAPRYFGLALIFAGIVALLISVWQYKWSIRYLWGGSFVVIAGAGGGKEAQMQTPVFALSVGLVIVCALAFIAVLLHIV